MAQPNVFYKGEEKKFAINIAAAGFDIDTDDFDIEVTNKKESFVVQKTGEPTEQGIWTNKDGSLVVFFETETVETPAEEPGGEPTVNTLRNIPRYKILRATGHSSEKAFVRYICYDED